MQLGAFETNHPRDLSSKSEFPNAAESTRDQARPRPSLPTPASAQTALPWTSPITAAPPGHRAHALASVRGNPDLRAFSDGAPCDGGGTLAAGVPTRNASLTSMLCPTSVMASSAPSSGVRVTCATGLHHQAKTKGCALPPAENHPRRTSSKTHERGVSGLKMAPCAFLTLTVISAASATTRQPTLRAAWPSLQRASPNLWPSSQATPSSGVRPLARPIKHLHCHNDVAPNRARMIYPHCRVPLRRNEREHL